MWTGVSSAAGGLRWRRQYKTELDGDKRSVVYAPLRGTRRKSSRMLATVMLEVYTLITNFSLNFLRVPIVTLNDLEFNFTRIIRFLSVDSFIISAKCNFINAERRDVEITLLHCVREKSNPLCTFYNSGKWCRILTKFCTNNAASNCKQTPKFQ